MTPLTLNLLTEEQQAEAASARDPVKFAIIIGVVILAVTAGCGVMMMMWAEQKKSEAERLQRRWDEMTTKQASGTFRALKVFAEDIVSIHQQRTLLAPQVARLKDLIPNAIYLTRAVYKINVEVGMSSSSKPQNIERLFLRLDGTAVGARPEIEVDNFLKVLRTDSILSNQVKEVTLRSIGRGPAVGGDGSQVMMAQFVIECLYKENR